MCKAIHWSILANVVPLETFNSLFKGFLFASFFDVSAVLVGLVFPNTALTAA